MEQENINYEEPTYKFVNINAGLSTEWKCYLFGSQPNEPDGFIYTPHKDNVPNFFVRYMMNVCLGCKWVKTKKE